MKKLTILLLLLFGWISSATAGPIFNSPLGTSSSPTFTAEAINGALTFTDATLLNVGTNILGQQNAANAQMFRVYKNTTNPEWIELNWQATADTAVIRTATTGGTARALQLRYGNTAGVGIIIGTNGAGTSITTGVHVAANGATSVASTIGRFAIGSGSSTQSTSSTSYSVSILEGFTPTSTSTMVGIPLNISPTINYSAVTPGAGHVEYIHVAATETAMPTGKNYAIRTLGGSAATQDLFAVTVTDPHIETGQATAPGLDAGCGTGATIVGTDTSGRITTNVTAFSSCIITFHKAWTNIPQCFEADETHALSTEAPVPTQTTLTFAGTGLVGGDIISYFCIGRV